VPAGQRGQAPAADPVPSSVARTLGLDVGYGLVKVCDGGRVLSFPSVVSDAATRRYRAEFAPADGEGQVGQLTVNGKDILVGESAIRHGVLNRRSLAPDRVTGSHFRLLALAAIAPYAQWERQTFSVVTGLPVAMFDAYRCEVEKNLAGEYRLTVKDGGRVRDRLVSLARPTVVPQPLGTFYHESLNSIGNLERRDWQEKSVGVVDVGFRTTDLVVVDRLEVVDRLSATLAFGVHDIYRLLAGRIRQEFGLTKDDLELQLWFDRDEVRVAGRRHDIRGFKREFVPWAVQKVRAEVDSLWDRGDLDEILITGGGASLVGDGLRAAYRNARVVNQPVFANVLGFARLAARLARGVGAGRAWEGRTAG